MADSTKDGRPVVLSNGVTLRYRAHGKQLTLYQEECMGRDGLLHVTVWWPKEPEWSDGRPLEASCHSQIQADIMDGLRALGCTPKILLAHHNTLIEI